MWSDIVTHNDGVVRTGHYTGYFILALMVDLVSPCWLAAVDYLLCHTVSRLCVYVCVAPKLFYFLLYTIEGSIVKY